MKQYNIAVLGATGAVGREMLKVLEEYRIPVGTLRPLASARSAGSTVPFCGKEIVVEEAREDSFAGMDFVLGAVSSGMGVSAKLKGYQYLLEAVLMMVDDPDMSITKELYPAVGNQCRTSGMLVERSIRSAVDSAWRRRDERTWRKLFRPDGTGVIPRPSNTVFMTALAKAYREKMR